ncbi:FAD:protein FMN transferase [Schaalia naturae]|uniref:FAD:protein FMN transferase n=3 Tax=Schaalia naturae TaxID=635203 RepID=A0ABW2SPM3_9ACTO
MGTLGHVSWGPAGRGEGDLARRLAGRAAHLEGLLTRFDPASEVSLLDGRWRPVGEDTAAVLSSAQDLCRRTRAGFSALLGARVRAWEGAARGEDAPGADPGPVRGRIEVSADAAGVSARVVGADPRAVDLGGIAKGYAADQLRDLAQASGASDVLVSLGRSSMAVAGAAARVALASPWRGLEAFGTLVLESGSLSVSADPGTRIGPGRQRSHALDPVTGRPAVTDLCGVVVCGEDGMVCEAFSTAYLVCGLDAALAMDREHPELRSIFMTVDGRVLADPALRVAAVPGAQRRLSSARAALPLRVAGPADHTRRSLSRK